MSADEFVGRLLDELRPEGLTEEIVAAIREVPRHRFAPEATLEEAYANDAVITKRNDAGYPISSVSAPWVQARMLKLSGLRRGMQVLEIGSGGYNAALMASIVGEQGRVLSIDIDPEVTERAARLLAETGYADRVSVLCADGTYGAPADLVPEGGWDVIMVTVQAPDLPQAWSDQLAEDGRLVVPLSVRGTRQVIAFEHDGDHLRSHGRTVCGFVGMQGDNRHGGRTVDLDGQGLLLTLGDDQEADEQALTAAVASGESHTVWSGVVLGPGEGVLPSLDLWLISSLPCARIRATAEAVEAGLSGWTLETAATWRGDTFAFLTIRAAENGFELGARAYGRDRASLAGVLASQVEAWNGSGRRGTFEPVFRAYRTENPVDRLPEGQVITNRYSRLLVSH
ncbi:methyltransferase, FxLD system [Streptomyces carpaticus]|uniref:Protein-L-isoaspartate O-methyltransferase n=1 Tax=Streptomyces carpaticus TaxID=285558 RepID=A0ABV4ZRZ3_9ACTN